MSIFPPEWELMMEENKKEEESWHMRIANGKKLRGFFGKDRIELNATLINELKSVVNQLKKLGDKKISLSSLINSTIKERIEFLRDNGHLDPDYSLDPDDYKSRKKLIQDQAIRLLNFYKRNRSISILELIATLKKHFPKLCENIDDKTLKNYLSEISHPAKRSRGRPKKSLF